MAGRGVDIILGGNPLIEEEAQEIKNLGGLHVLGTERHDSRRIDNQLRGRCGRQGDPGSSNFFISLEDDLLKIFGGEKLKNLLNFLKVEEDQPIESKMISSAIEKAQTKVEGLHFDSRKHVLEYDDVISKQRNKIYSQRDNVLTMNFDKLQNFVKDIVIEEAGAVFGTEEIKTILPFPVSSKEEIVKVINDLFHKREEKEGVESFQKLLKFVVLKSLDSFWTEHLVNLEHLKDSVRLRAYGGKDPLVEYKTEGHKMFQGLWDSINSQIARTVFKISFN